MKQQPHPALLSDEPMFPGGFMLSFSVPAGLQTASVSEEQSAGPVQSDREGV